MVAIIATRLVVHSDLTQVTQNLGIGTQNSADRSRKPPPVHVRAISTRNDTYLMVNFKTPVPQSCTFPSEYLPSQTISLLRMVSGESHG
jgi:hypothetical protein